MPDTFSGEGAALIYDENYQQKPAYTAVHDALAAGGGGDDTTAPTAPGTPSAANITGTSATLTWTAATDSGGSGLAGYTVYREQGSTDQQLGQSATNSITLAGLSPATQYQVYVRARDGAGNLSTPSATATFTTTSGGGQPGGPCTATGTVQTQWNNGYVVQPVTVATPEPPPGNGWTRHLHPAHRPLPDRLLERRLSPPAGDAGHRQERQPQRQSRRRHPHQLGFQVSRPQRQHPDPVP